jgi:trk system potassium uptake protein TrkA
MKEFAVIGLGNFGATVARELARLKCKVTAIDSNKALVQSLQGSVHMAIVANATEREFLENLEVDKFDAFVVSTGEDTDASILIALYLKELGAQKIIVKAKTEDHAKILLKVGASQAMIPEKQMATRIAHSLSETNLVDYLPLSEEYFVAEVPPPRKFIDKTLIDQVQISHPGHRRQKRPDRRLKIRSRRRLSNPILGYLGRPRPRRRHRKTEIACACLCHVREGGHPYVIDPHGLPFAREYR